PLEVMHFRMPVLGYRLDNFAYITDAKTISEETVLKLQGVEYLVINALQKEPHISHFTLAEAVAFAELIGAKMTYLTHISHRLGLHAEVSKELPPTIQLAYDRLTLNI